MDVLASRHILYRYPISTVFNLGSPLSIFLRIQEVSEPINVNQEFPSLIAVPRIDATNSTEGNSVILNVIRRRLPSLPKQLKGRERTKHSTNDEAVCQFPNSLDVRNTWAV